MVRWRFSFPVLQKPQDVLFRIEAPVPRGANRIRVAWKLVATVEQPRQVQHGGMIDSPVADSGSNGLVGAVLGLCGDLGQLLAGAWRLKHMRWTADDAEDGPRDLVRHAAPSSLEGIVAPVLAGQAPDGPDGVEEVWAPGRPEPKPSTAVIPSASRPKVRCRFCAEEVFVADAERVGICPRCGETWY
ncbi:MAG: hypothetical protein QM765_30275 [Myxococcales bacterium]